MPSWELLSNLDPESNLKSFEAEKKTKGLSGSSQKVDGNFQRFGPNAKLNTIQMGLAAVFNPDTYVQQQKRRIPFIPGAFKSSWLTVSQEDGLPLSTQSESMEKTVSSPILTNASTDKDTCGNILNSDRKRPSKLFGLNKCQSFN